MYIIRFKQFRSKFPYRTYNTIKNDVIINKDTTTAPNTTITDVPETLTSNVEIEGAGIKKKKLVDKFKTLAIHNPENKYKRFINLKL